MEFVTALTVALSLLILLVAHQIMTRGSFALLRDVYDDGEVARSTTRLGATVLFLLAAGAAGLFLRWLATVTPTTDLSYLGLGLSGTAVVFGLVFGIYLLVIVHLRNERERVASLSYGEW